MAAAERSLPEVRKGHWCGCTAPEVHGYGYGDRRGRRGQRSGGRRGLERSSNHMRVVSAPIARRFEVATADGAVVRANGAD